MKINGEEVSINDLIDDNFENTKLIKRKNNMYLSNEQVKVLEKYNINYLNYSSIKDIIFVIEEILNEESDVDDLENVSIELSEYNYYYYTNK